MFMIILHVDGVASPFALRFRTADGAEGAWTSIVVADYNAEIRFVDDFGQKLNVYRSMIRVPQFMDVGRDLEAQGEAAVLQARAQADAQAKASGGLVRATHPGLVRAQ